MSSELSSVLLPYLDAFLSGKKRSDNIKLRIYFYVSSSTSTRDKESEMSWVFFSLMIKHPRFQGRQLRGKGQGFKQTENLGVKLRMHEYSLSPKHRAPISSPQNQAAPWNTQNARSSCWQRKNSSQFWPNFGHVLCMPLTVKT